MRIIAAAGIDLEEEVRQGRFREDLYYRLAVFPLRIPSLREQARADIIQVAEQLVQSLSASGDQNAPVRILPETADLLARYAWPGNVREMRNVFERILILYPNASQIRPEDLPPELRGENKSDLSSLHADPTLPLEEVERNHIRSALKYFQGNKSQVAQSLRIGRRTLYDKMAKYDLA